jgi:hypothetical protein
MIARFFSQPGPKAVFVSLLLLVLVLLAGIYAGWLMAHKEMGITPRYGSDGTQLELLALRKELNVVLGDIQAQRTRHNVDSRALELVRNEMVVQKELTASLEEGLRFFRNLMVSDGSAADGLSLHEPELVAGETPGRVKYRIFVQHQSRADETVEGILSLQVFGFEGEEEVRYTFAQLSEEFDDRDMLLQFRYFQAVEGLLTLPEDFEPLGLTVAVQATKPHKKRVREEFPWVLQEKFVTVGE